MQSEIKAYTWEFTEECLLPVTGRSFWVLGLLRTILTALGTVRPADFRAGPANLATGLVQEFDKNG